MKTLKDTIYNILLSKPETRDSRTLLYWEILRHKGFIEDDGTLIMAKSDFMRINPESIRRCSQQLQREDLLLGKNLIQPTAKVKKQREQLSKEKGYSFIQGQFNSETKTYETN
jgi:hypothetical protein